MKVVLSCIAFLISLQLSAQTFSVDQLRSDFDTLRSALEEAHGGLYRHHSRSEMANYLDKQRKELKRPMNEFEFFGFLSRLLAWTGDGHMRVDYDEKAHSHIAKPLQFPFRLLMEKDKTIILSNDTPNDITIKPGMELLKINGRSIREIRKTLLSFLRSDGYNQTGKQARMERSFGTHYWSFISRSATFAIEAKDSSGKIINTTVKGIANGDRDKNRNQNPVNASMLLLTKSIDVDPVNLSLGFINDSIARLRVRLFDGKRFTQEIDSLFRITSTRNIKALIIDLRGNSGGLDHLGAYLMSKLTTKSFRYLDRIHTPVLIPSFATWKQKPPVDIVNGTVVDPNGGFLLKPMLNNTLSEQTATTNSFTGKLIVLIDGNTFSAASDFSAILSNLTNAVFVGVETGGGYQGNTSGLNTILSLPNSRFNVNIHLWDYWSAVKPPKKKGRGVMPHHHVQRGAAEWLRGIDTQLTFAIKLLE